MRVRRKINPGEIAEMRLRYTRFRVACALEGQGAAKKFAEEHNTNSTIVCHALAGKRGGRNQRIRKSWRLEQAADRFIQDVFGRHASVLALPAPSPDQGEG